MATGNSEMMATIYAHGLDYSKENPLHCEFGQFCYSKDKQ